MKKLRMILTFPILIVVCCVFFAACGKKDAQPSDETTREESTTETTQEESPETEQISNQPLELSQILSRMSNNFGNLIVTGETIIIGADSFQRNVTLHIEVNNGLSIFKTENQNMHNDDPVWFSEDLHYIYQENGTSYREKYGRYKEIDGLWYIYPVTTSSSGQPNTLLNAFLDNSNFKGFDEDMFTQNADGNYVLKNALTLSPMWNGFLNRILSMTIIPKQNGANFVFEASGNIESVGDVTADFNMEITFGNSKLTRPNWAK